LSGGNEVEPKHQNVLRACNIQDVLIEAMSLDNQIAWKGSICTEREKVESERRLTLVKRALLCVCTAFVYSNKINQELLFVGMSSLEEMATPPALQVVTDEDGFNGGLDARTQEERVAAEASLGSGAWPHTVCEITQFLIQTILRSNTSLCERVKPSLLSLFLQVANLASDVSESPALDLVFILAKPEETPDREHQILACSLLASSQTSDLGLLHLFQSVSSCFDHASNRAMGSFVDDGANMRNPSRIIRLVKVVIEGGNEEAATMLQQSAGITIDATCSALVAHIEQTEAAAACLAKASIDSSAGQGVSLKEGLDVIGRQDDKGSSTVRLHPEAVLQLVTNDGSIGTDLMCLLVEQFFILPLNTDQVMSLALWAFIDRCAVPCMEAIGKLPKMNDQQLNLCTDLVDFLEKFTMTLVRLGLYDSVKDVPSKERALADISEDIETLLSKRQKTPEFLKTAFLEEVEKRQRSYLEIDEFVVLVVKLTESASAARKISDARRKELEEEFRKADADCSGGIDLYEFEALYETTKASVDARNTQGSQTNSVSVNRPGLPPSETVVRAIDTFKKSLREVDIEASMELEHDKTLTFTDIDVENSNVLHRQGHRLSLRTVECGERIVHIQKGRGNELGAKRFDRHDKFGVRRRGATGGKSTKLFGRSTLTTNAGATAKKKFNEELQSAESVPTAMKLQAFKEGVSSSCAHVWLCPCTSHHSFFFKCMAFHR
jgi:hypothetical protein